MKCGIIVVNRSLSGITRFMQQKVDLGNAVLRGVSRSFFLTIRLLPRLMREPVSLGYLLARASDTIADTEGVGAEVRGECLSVFYDALTDHDVREGLCRRLREEFIGYQENEKERLLLESLGDVFGWYDTVSQQDWDAIAGVMRPILDGQLWDVDYFSVQGHVQVGCDADLERYCYQVAGSVGEFWGVVGVNADHRYSSYDAEALRVYGVRYGKGLQLVNILRDLPEDLRNGRCYLPGVDGGDFEAVMRESVRWRDKARGYLEDGLAYSGSLRKRRTRMATCLPAMIGVKTLDLMDEASWDEWEGGLKVPRKEIRKSFLHAMRH